MFLFERDSEWVGEEQRETEIEYEAGSRLQAVSTEPDAGLKPTNRETMIWAKVRHLADWDTQSGCQQFQLILQS